MKQNILFMGVCGGVRFYAPTANKILRALRANVILFACCMGITFFAPTTTNAQTLNDIDTVWTNTVPMRSTLSTVIKLSNGNYLAYGFNNYFPPSLPTYSRDVLNQTGSDKNEVYIAEFTESGNIIRHKTIEANMPTSDYTDTESRNFISHTRVAERPDGGLLILSSFEFGIGRSYNNWGQAVNLLTDKYRFSRIIVDNAWNVTSNALHGVRVNNYVYAGATYNWVIPISFSELIPTNDGKLVAGSRAVKNLNGTRTELAVKILLDYDGNLWNAQHSSLSVIVDQAVFPSTIDVLNNGACAFSMWGEGSAYIFSSYDATSSTPYSSTQAAGQHRPGVVLDFFDLPNNGGYFAAAMVGNTNAPYYNNSMQSAFWRLNSSFAEETPAPYRFVDNTLETSHMLLNNATYDAAGEDRFLLKTTSYATNSNTILSQKIAQFVFDGTSVTYTEGPDLSAPALSMQVQSHQNDGIMCGGVVTEAGERRIQIGKLSMCSGFTIPNPGNSLLTTQTALPPLDFTATGQYPGATLSYKYNVILKSGALASHPTINVGDTLASGTTHTIPGDLYISSTTSPAVLLFEYSAHQEWGTPPQQCNTNTSYEVEVCNNLLSPCLDQLVATATDTLISNIDALYTFESNNPGSDLSGNNNHLAPLGGLSFETTGTIAGSAARFDGTGALENNNPAFMSGEIDGFTVGFWMKPDVPVNATDYQVLFEEGGASNGISLVLQNNNLIANFVHGSAANVIQITAPYPQDGEWHHVVLQKNGTEAYLYIDGSIEACTIAVPVDTGTGNLGAHEAYSAFGARHSGSGGLAGSHTSPVGYKGLMDEIFYSRQTIKPGAIIKYLMCSTPGDFLPSIGCTNDAFVSSWLNTDSVLFYDMNLVTGEYDKVKVTDVTQINAIGYNKNDGLIYGAAHVYFGTGTDPSDRISVVTITGVDMSNKPYRYITKNVARYTGWNGRYCPNTGDVFDNKLVTKGAESYALPITEHNIDITSPDYLEEIYRKDINSGNSMYTNADWAYNPEDSLLYAWYGVNSQLISVDPNDDYKFEVVKDNVVYSGTGALETRGTGAVFFDSDGFLYINLVGEIVRIDIDDPNAQLIPFSNVPSTPGNDAARCPDAPMPVDFADAPDSTHSGNEAHYITALIDGGPRHYVDDYNAVTHTSLLMLGSKVDIDIDGITTSKEAQGDDEDDIDDEDAVSTPLILDQIATNYSINIGVTNLDTANAYLMGWIDFNANGLFESSELAYSTVSTGLSAAAGDSITLSWNAPALQGNEYFSIWSDTTYLRLRITTDTAVYKAQNSRSTGMADNGEVEDHIINFILPVADYGDAPASFATLTADNGAAHIEAADNYKNINAAPGADTIPDLILGYSFDIELDGQPVAAGADNNSSKGDGYDEDGVSLYNPTVGDTYYSINAIVNNVTKAKAYVSAWLDLNGNGVFDAAERTTASHDGSAVTDSTTFGTVLLQWANLSPLQTGNLYLRVRVSTDSLSIVMPNGVAPDGEVEDYRIEVNDPGVAEARCGYQHYYEDFGHINDGQGQDFSVAGQSILQNSMRVQAPISTNLVFENGNPYGEDDDPIPSNSYIGSGQYSVVNYLSALNGGTSWTQYVGDHTTGNNDLTGRMFVGNSRMFGNSDLRIKSIKVTPNTNYRLDFYATNVEETGLAVLNAPPTISYSVLDKDGNTLVTKTTVLAVRGIIGTLLVWEHLDLEFNTANHQEVQFLIRAVGWGIEFGYDWAIDDISIKAACDCGDLPDTNAGTTGTGNYHILWPHGPTHHVPEESENIFMGTPPDFSDGNGLPSLNAKGDDTTGIDDEDALNPKVYFYQDHITLENIPVVNNTGKPGYLYGWIDGNQDGTFDNNTERVKADIPAGFNGTTSLLFNNFSNSLETGNHYVRLRTGSIESEISEPNQRLASDGEVEDHMIYILTLDSLRGMMPKNATLNGVQHNGFEGNPVSVLFNEHITYEITAVNASLGVGSIAVTDTLPYYLNYSTGSASAGGVHSTTTGSPARDIITWNLNNIASMKDTTVTIQATPESGACATQPLFFNKAWVTIKATDTITVQTGNMTHHQGAGVSIITFSAAFGGEIFNAREQALDYKTAPSGDILIVPEEGYKFAGWSHQEYRSLRGELIEAKSGIMHHDTLIVHGRVELRAEFAPEEYPITYFLNHADNHELNPPEYTILSDSIRIHAPSKRDDEFLGWTTGDTGQLPVKDFCIPKGSTGEVRLYAHFLHTGREKEDDEKDTADNLWSENGFLFIETVAPQSDIRIYSTDGKLHQMRNNVTPGLTKINLAHGVYIVTINGNAGRKILMR